MRLQFAISGIALLLVAIGVIAQQWSGVILMLALWAVSMLALRRNWSNGQFALGLLGALIVARVLAALLFG